MRTRQRRASVMSAGANRVRPSCSSPRRHLGGWRHPAPSGASPQGVRLHAVRIGAGAYAPAVESDKPSSPTSLATSHSVSSGLVGLVLALMFAVAAVASAATRLTTGAANPTDLSASMPETPGPSAGRGRQVGGARTSRVPTGRTRPRVCLMIRQIDCQVNARPRVKPTINVVVPPTLGSANHRPAPVRTSTPSSNTVLDARAAQPA